ncbi:NAD(P)/FAD-dependent oxidoreductase [Paracoccus spongiarum]|uniref:FAD-binding oxidoreductase n=1 Tax=Paracoccus spongiarum TaxID=3064387 RepID=A0ABT9JCQ8_9RHOB|nr:FAD-binding oxidoreductase [Paracoccus sp. 2205BS29-5]MDP5307598.1 FAD-binding oxidoreductase [Paracoccus sp. 2205BS29-5]
MNLLYANDRRGSYPRSVYADTCQPLPPFPALRGETRADVGIVGAGYTGLSAALHLARRGYRVALIEAHRAGFGASGRNGGQMGSGQRQEVDWLERNLGRAAARRLWDLAEEAKALVRSLAAESGVPLREGVAHACRSAGELDHARRMAEHLAGDYGYDRVEVLERAELARHIGSTAYAGGDLDRGAGHLHPLNLALGLARLAAEAGVAIHETTHVHRLTHAARAGATSILHCDTGRVVCDHVILAANGYLGGLDGRIAARVMPINNYIVATEPLGDRFPHILPTNCAVADTRFVVNYWRLDDDRRLIFGGGETATYRFPKDIAAVVRPHLLSVYPELRDVALTHAWGGTLAITMNRMPCFARPAANCLSASGFSGHGVAMATLAGRLMAEAVAGQAEGFDAMAAVPMRSFPGGAMLRSPLLVAGMAWFGLRDRLGF